jgi:hypothetical protein
MRRMEIMKRRRIGNRSLDSSRKTTEWSLSMKPRPSGTLIKDLVIKSRIGGQEWMFKEAIQQINLNGFGRISILSESPIKEYMAQEGKQLILTSFGEMTENMLNAGRGAFSWWNLLQIPVELIVGKLMRSNRFTDLQAYGLLSDCSWCGSFGRSIWMSGLGGLLDRH